MAKIIEADFEGTYPPEGWTEAGTVGKGGTGGGVIKADVPRTDAAKKVHDDMHYPSKCPLTRGAEVCFVAEELAEIEAQASRDAEATEQVDVELGGMAAWCRDQLREREATVAVLREALERILELTDDGHGTVIPELAEKALALASQPTQAAAASERETP